MSNGWLPYQWNQGPGSLYGGPGGPTARPYMAYPHSTQPYAGGSHYSGPYLGPASTLMMDPTNRDAVDSLRKGGPKDDRKEKKKKKKQQKRDGKGLVYGCDECGKQPLLDTRYNCTKCKDYDLCVDCFASPDAKHVHHMAFLRPVHIPEAGVDPLGAIVDGGETQKSSSTTGSSWDDTKQNPKPTTREGEGDDVIDMKAFTSQRYGAESDPLASSGSGVVKDFMDYMNETLIKAGIKPLPTSKMNSRDARSFRHLVQVGWGAIADVMGEESALSIASPAGQLVSLNAMIFAGFPQGKIVDNYNSKGPSSSFVIQTLLYSSIFQLIHVLDTAHNEVRSNQTEPNQLSDLDELESIKIYLAGAGAESGLKIFKKMIKQIRQLWKNAFELYDNAHPMRKQITSIARKALTVFRQMDEILMVNVPARNFELLEATIESKGSKSSKKRARSVDSSDDDHLPQPIQKQMEWSPTISMPTSSTSALFDSRWGPVPTTMEGMKEEIVRLREAVLHADNRLINLLTVVESGLSRTQHSVSALRQSLG